MARALLLIACVSASLLPALCTAGLVQHPCAGGAAEVAHADEGSDSSCPHEQGCSEDPCSLVAWLVRDDAFDEAAVLEAWLAPVTLVARSFAPAEPALAPVKLAGCPCPPLAQRVLPLLL